MNVHEAIMMLEADKLAAYFDTSPHESLINALDMAIETLKKQQPEKPVKCSQVIFSCPNCEKLYNGVLNPRFCSECGQALDWGI